MKKVLILASIIVLLSVSIATASSIDFVEIKKCEDIYSLIGKTAKFKFEGVTYVCKITGVSEKKEYLWMTITLYISGVTVAGYNEDVKAIAYHYSPATAFYTLEIPPSEMIDPGIDNIWFSK